MLPFYMTSSNYSDLSLNEKLYYIVSKRLHRHKISDLKSASFLKSHSPPIDTNISISRSQIKSPHVGQVAIKFTT